MFEMIQIVIPETVLFRDLDGEAVLLATESGKYFGLNEVGTRMWSLLRLHGDVEQVCCSLLAEYDVPEERLRLDLAQFVGRLADRGLIKNV